MAGYSLRGFTLIELVIVIVLLAIIGTFSFRFIGLGAQVYSDASAREQLVSQSRFALERLSRELRNALPNSIRTRNSGLCIDYLPIVTSGQYLTLPEASGPTDSVSVVTPLQRPIPLAASTPRYFAAHVADTSALYADAGPVVEATLSTAANNFVSEFLFATEQGFAERGPAPRFYYVTAPVSWCLQAGELKRMQWPDLSTPPTTGTTMATQLTNSSAEPLFQVEAPTLARSNLVLIDFRFSRTDAAEPLSLLYEVHIPNVL